MNECKESTEEVIRAQEDTSFEECILCGWTIWDCHCALYEVDYPDEALCWACHEPMPGSVCKFCGWDEDEDCAWLAWLEPPSHGEA